jgi:hypothetical protein
MAMLVAELTDNDGWTSLIELAEIAGNGQLREQLQTASIMRTNIWTTCAAGSRLARSVGRRCTRDAHAVTSPRRAAAAPDGRGPEQPSVARPKRRPKSRARARMRKTKSRGRSAR